MSSSPIQIAYCSWSNYKKEEWALAKDAIELDATGKKLGELFDIRFRKVATTEPLLCDLEAMVKFKVESAYRQIQVPCIVEHAGLILEGFADKSFPGGLTQPMWDSLAPEQFLAACSTLTSRAVARAVVGYCDGLNVHTFLGETRGTLSNSPRGTREFYWDTIFCPDGFDGRTYAEIVKDDRSGLGEKLAVSQSIKALKAFMLHRLAAEPSLFPAL
ncbi:Ham1 family protein [Bradyrhizobium sp. Rc3b]|uniref:non-canonical purine NTP pyrophosphatase n=1 Tax=Bradyrhizobium sp. Rc3b TaxID=1855322 RepID=UPI0008E4EC48|nr:non-canonical purine NTP pyrophosphatase [Bradyrhizobium sp. Rc3b]SFN50539.1 Ham1 family protein [Bradyrhizobium sp. Rc3b]